MIVSTSKNYFKYIKYIFIPMGIIYLAVILAAFSMSSYLINMVDSATGNEFVVYFQETFTGVTVNQIFSSVFWKGAINEFTGIINSGDGTIPEFLALTIGMSALVVMACSVAGSLTGMLLKKDMEIKGRFFIIAIIIKLVISWAFSALLVFLAYLWPYSILLLFIAFLLLKALENLIVIKYVFFKDFEVKKIINFGNFFKLLLAYFIAGLIFIAFVVIIWLISSPLLAILIAIPLFVYSSAVIECSTIDYFKSELRKG